MATNAAADQLTDFYGLIRGKYLTAEVRYLPAYHGVGSAVHYQDEHGVLVDVYSLAEWRRSLGDDWATISEYLQRFFPEDLSQYAVVSMVVNSPLLNQVAASFGTTPDALLRKYTQYLRDRQESLTAEGDGIQGFFDALAFYQGNSVLHPDRYTIAQSRLEVVSRDFELVFDDLRPNIYDAQDLFQRMPISEEFPFAVLLNYNLDQQLRVNDQFHDWSAAAQSRIQSTIERARTYLQRKAKRLGEIIDARWERTVDAFQIDHDRFPRLDQQLRAFIAVGLHSDPRRNVDLLLFKIGESRAPLTGRISFPTTVQPDLERIEQLLTHRLLPTYTRQYHVHRYRGTVSYYGVAANQHLFPFLLINPLDNIWRLDESRSLLATRQKVSYLYHNVDPTIGFGVQIRVSWMQQSHLTTEQTLTDRYGNELTFPAGTPISTFSFARGRRVSHLERVANQLQLLLIGQQLLEYQLTHPSPGPAQVSAFGLARGPANAPGVSDLLQYDQLRQASALTRAAMTEVVERWEELARWQQWFQQRYPGKSLTDSRPSTGHFTVRREQRIDRLRQVAPDIIDERYPERCTGKKQPEVVPYRRNQYRRDDPHVVHLPPDDPQYTFVCTSPQYPYATLVYADQNLYPCCNDQPSLSQVNRAIAAFHNQDPSARSRQSTIKPLEYNGTGIVPSRLAELHELATGAATSLVTGSVVVPSQGTTLVRVGVDKRSSLLTAAYFALTTRQLTDGERLALLAGLERIHPSLLAEQNWSDPAQALISASQRMTYSEHFRLVTELLREFTNRRFNLLAITGGRDEFTFVYPNYRRTLAWRPDPTLPTAVVFEHPDNVYDAVATKSLLTLSPYNARELVGLFNQTVRLMSPIPERAPYRHYFQRELPPDLVIIGQQLDHDGHQVAVAGRWPTRAGSEGTEPDETIYYFLTTPRPPDNVPTFETFNQAPPLPRILNRLDQLARAAGLGPERGRRPRLGLDASRLDALDRELITTVNFQRQPLWSEVVGVRQGRWYLIGVPGPATPVDPIPATNITLPIDYTSDLATIGQQLLDIYYTATWLKHLIHQLLWLHQRASGDQEPEVVIRSFLERYLVVSDQSVIYPDQEQLPSLEITPTTTVDQALDQLVQRAGASFVVNGRLLVARSVRAKLPEFCRRVYYAVPRAELRPPHHKSWVVPSGRGLWFNQQIAIDLNELRVQIHSQLPKTGTYIYIRVAAENAVFAIRRYDSYDNYIMEHPELYHQVIRFNQWSYTNETLTYKDAKNHRYPPTTYSLTDATPDQTLEVIVTDGPIYLIVERYYQVGEREAESGAEQEAETWAGSG